MSDYDLDRIGREIAALGNPAPDTTTKGRRLQDLMEYLLGEIQGVAIARRNKMDFARTTETDLWLRVDRRVADLPFSGMLVPVECKNEDESASSAEIREFASKVKLHGGFDGLFIARQGISGGPQGSAHEAVTVALGDRVSIIVLAGSDLLKLARPQDLTDLIIDRHIELRTLRTYRSI